MLPILIFLGSKLMEAMPVLFLGKMVFSPLWSGYKRSQQKFVTLLGQKQKHAAEKLAKALAELVARGKNRGLDSYELYRNLEALLSLLCLDVCHQHVAPEVRDLSTKIARKQHRAMRRGKHKIGVDSAGELRLRLLWNPDYAEVFKATKVYAKKRDMAPSRTTVVKHLKELSWVEMGKIPKLADAQRAFRVSVEGIFNRATEMHETQKKLAEAFQDYALLLDDQESLREESDLDEVAISDEVLSSKQVEVEELLDKLRELSVPDKPDSPTGRPELGNVDDVAVLSVEQTTRNHQQRQWHEAAYPLLLLINRFEVRRPLPRKRKIAELFKAVGATDADRKEIERHIGVLYRAIRTRWSKDGWIEQVRRDVFPTRRRRKLSRLSRRTNRPSPFSEFLMRGWGKEKKQRRFLFTTHYSTFELKGPKQLTEEGVLGMVQAMEDQEDKIFVRTFRLNRELQEIYDCVQENTRHGKFDAVIADLKILDDRVSGREKKKYPPEMVSQICSYLAFMYAYRGEHLEEAVRLAQRSMRLHDTWLARLTIGWCYHRQGKVRKAVKELEVAKSAASHDGSGLLPLVHLVLGDACRDAKWNRKAQQAWQAGWELADDLAWKEQPGLTPFEVDERAALQKELSERLG